MHFSELRIKGFKALADVTVSLHRLNVVIGPNGAGKTSLIEVFQLLKNAANRNLEAAIAALGGLDSVLNSGTRLVPRLEVAVQADISSYFGAQDGFRPLTYAFGLSANVGGGYRVDHDVLESPGHQGVIFDRSTTVPGFQTGASTLRQQEILLSQLSMADSYEAAILNSELSRIYGYGLLDLQPRSPIRLPQTLTLAHHPGFNGDTLFAFLYNLRDSKSNRTVFERLEETLQLAFPGYDRMELPVVGAGQIILEWNEKHLTRSLYPSQLSAGTLRFLWLASILLMPDPPSLVLIDEPEISLHPQLLQILAALMRDASARTQLVIATQSSDLIRWLRADEVLIADKEDGRTTFTWASDLDLDEWLKEFTLSDLWYMGNLGGRS